MDNISSLISFFALNGHRPPITDCLYPLNERMLGRKKVAFLSISTSAIRTASVQIIGGKPVVSAEDTAIMKQGESPLRHALFYALRKKTNCGYVIVQIGEIETVQIMSGVRKQTPVAEVVALSHDVKSLIGNETNADLRYGMISSSTNNISIVASIERTFVESVASGLSSQRLHAIRTQISTLTLMGMGLSHPDVAAGNADLLILDNANAVFMHSSEAGGWAKIRMRNRILTREPGLQLDEFRDLLEQETTRPIVVINTHTHPESTQPDLKALLEPSAIPGSMVKSFEVPGYSAAQLTVLASLCDTYAPGLNYGIPNILRGLAHDISTIDVEPTPLLAPWTRWIAIGLYGGIACMGIGVALLEARSGASLIKTAQISQYEIPINASITQDKNAITELKRRALLAQNVRGWLDDNSMLQPLMVNLSKVLDSKVRVTYLSIQRAPEGTSGATHRMNIQFSAEPQRIKIILDGLKQAALDAGWEFTPDAQSSNNGITKFEAFLGLKRPQVALNK